jgi:hypothetical protein
MQSVRIDDMDYTKIKVWVMCPQVLCCLSCLGRSRASGVTMRPDTRITILSTCGTQCM